MLQKLIDKYEKTKRGIIMQQEDPWTAQDRPIEECFRGKYFILHTDYYKLTLRHCTDNIFNKKLFLQDARSELDEVIKVLSFYLKKEQEKLKSIQYEQIRRIYPKHIINFNYTSTYTEIYSDKTPIFYQHGNLLDDSKMVLGIPDSEDISLDFIYFKKFFQRIQKRCGTVQNVVFDKLEEMITGYPTVYFLGLSMGRTDEDIIKNIIDKAEKSIIFYYDQDDYEGKIINLIDIYGRTNVETMMEEDDIEFIKLDKKQHEDETDR